MFYSILLQHIHHSHIHLPLSIMIGVQDLYHISSQPEQVLPGSTHPKTGGYPQFETPVAPSDCKPYNDKIADYW